MNSVVHTLCNKAELHHIDRLKSGKCSLQQGTSFGELLTNLEQISVHCYKIVMAMLEANTDNYDLNSVKGHGIQMKENTPVKKAYDEYSQKYTFS